MTQVQSPIDLSRNWVRLYSLADDAEGIAAMQRVSLSRDRSSGLARRPLVGSKRWWSQVRSDRRPLIELDGEILRVVWGGMADMPEFEIDVNGEVRSELCMGDCRRYVAGLGVRYSYVEHAWKDPDPFLGESSEIAIEVWVEESDLRSSGIAPGPGGVGYEHARWEGDVVHYLEFSEKASAASAVESLRQGPWSQISRCMWSNGLWHVQVWERKTAEEPPRIRELMDVVAPLGGLYDGGEEVDGAVWGPDRYKRMRFS